MNSSTQWLPASQAQSLMSPETWRLISNPGSMTQKLRELTAGKIQFRLLDASWDQPTPDEVEKLAELATQPTWIRNIEHRYDDKLWVFGRTVTPKTTLMMHSPSLEALGERSIGDIIFNDASSKRDVFEYCPLNKDHPYLQKINQDSQMADKTIWARRSMLYFHNKPMLIIEAFLPEFLKNAH